MLQAVERANAGDWAAAALLFKEATEADPTQWGSWSDGSVALERAGQLDTAVEWLVIRLRVESLLFSQLRRRII